MKRTSKTAIPITRLKNVGQRFVAFRYSRSIIAATLVSLFLYLNYFCVGRFLQAPISMEKAIWAGFLLGQFVAQTNLIAICATLGSGSWLLRLPWALLLTLIQWISLVSGVNYFLTRQFTIDVAEYESVTLGAYLFLSVALASIPWLVARYVFGWRLGVPGETANPESRFDLREIFGAMLLLALTLGLIRIAGDINSGGTLLWDTRQFLSALPDYYPLVFFNAVVVTPSVWLVLSRKLNPVNIGTALLCIVIVPSWMATLMIGTDMLAFHRPRQIAFAAYAVSQGLVAYCSLLLLRCTGLVLRRS